MKTNLKRILSVICALALCVGMLPMSAFAAEPVDPAGSDYVQNGEEVTTEDGVTVSKTAEQTDTNEYEITLSVTVPDSATVPGQDTDVVLVIDASSSMDGSNIRSAKAAAQSFAKALLDEDIQAGVNLAVVTYTEWPSTECGLTDDLRTIEGAIDDIQIRYNQGTNIQAGIYQARTILEDSTAANKVIVLLSDGDPTYSYPVRGTSGWSGCDYEWGLWHDWDEGRWGDGTPINISLPSADEVTEEDFDYTETTGIGSSYTSSVHAILDVECEHGETREYSYDGDERPFKNNGDPAIAEAGFAKEDGCEIYSLYLGRPSSDAEHTMGGIATDLDHYQQASNDNLSGLLEKIAGDVISTTAGAVTDPMGEHIVLGDVSGLGGVKTTQDGLTWTPTEGQGRENPDGFITYTVTYPITVDADAADFKEGWLEANGTTTFTYYVNGSRETIEFNVPKVWGEATDKTETNEVYVKVYLDNVDVTDAWETYLSDLTTTGTTEAQGDPTYDGTSGCIEVPYTYEDIDAADVEFSIQNGVVLQGITGTFVYGSSGWHEVAIADGTWTVDNVDGDSTLSIYLNTPYEIQYHSSNNVVTAEGTYIDGDKAFVSKAESPDFSGISEESSLEERNWGVSGSWKNNDLQTVAAMPQLPGAGEGQTAQGWWLNNSSCEGEVDYAVGDTYIISDNDADSSNIIHFYSTVTDNTYTIVVEVVNGTAEADGLVDGSISVTHNSTSEIQFTAEDGYVLDTVMVDGTAAELTGGSYTFFNVTKNHSISVVYAQDSNGDNIPDKYQAFVKFLAKENGSVTGTGVDQVFTLKDSDGNYATSGTITPSLDNVIVTPEEGYAFDIWTEGNGTAAVNPEDPREVGGGTTVTFYANFAIDGIGPENPEHGDGIPDKYQATVTYKVVNGTWQDETTADKVHVFTLKQKDLTTGEWTDVTPAPTLGETVPTGMLPDENHTNSGKWDTIPTEGTTVTRNATYTYTFDEEIRRAVQITKTLIEVNNNPYNGGMVSAGDTLTYEIKVKNTGNVDLTFTPGLWIQDTVTINDKSEVSDLLLEITEVKVGEEKSDTYTYVVPDGTEGQTITNTAVLRPDIDENKDIDDGDGDEASVIVYSPDLDIKKTAVIEDKDLSNGDKAEVGDTITYTITITNTGNQVLENVTVKDSLWKMGMEITVNGSTAYVANGGQFTIKEPIATEDSVTITYTYAVTEADANSGQIKNAVTATSDEGTTGGGENVVDVVPVVTITPANITVYTGGDGYSGVTDAEGNIIETTEESGLPEPGYHIDLPEAVEAWLLEHTQSDTDNEAGARDLAGILKFTYEGAYTDGSGETAKREWPLTYVGIYETDESGNPTRFVYSLEASETEDESEAPIPVRLVYFDDVNNDGKFSQDEIKTNDDILMDEHLVSDTYSMTINPGELDQSQIKAVFTVGDESITCNINIGLGTITVRSTTDGETTNEIAADTGDVDDDVITALAGEDVTYYVNNSEVEVGSDRVQLLVDSVSNSPEFNASMGVDAIDHVNKSLSNAAYESAYLDLVDTENGNAVVTMGEDDSLTIYWPVPDDAAADSEFHIVHYTGMDREGIVDLEKVDPNTVEVTDVSSTIVTIDGQKYVVFETDSFSPFVLVYEQEENQPVNPPHGGDDDDDDGGSRPSHRPSHRPDRDDEPEDLNTEDHVAYLIGFTDGTIRPEADITRAEVATIFFRLLTDEARETYWSQTNAYSDVAPDAWYNNAVSTLTNMGILDGYLDGTFRPNAPITRSEFTKIAVSFFDYTAGEYSYEGWFSDVQGGEWFVEYLTAAMRFGLIEGMPDGTFRPLDNITRAEACTIVNRTLGREPHEDYLLSERRMNTWPDNSTTAWYYADMQEATNSHDYAWITINKGEDDEMEVEEWTEKLEERDWAELEQIWSDAHDAPGGEVMD